MAKMESAAGAAALAAAVLATGCALAGQAGGQRTTAQVPRQVVRTLQPQRLAQRPQEKPETARTLQRSEGIPGGAAAANGLTVPPGFRINLFADGLVNPRRLCIAPGGTATAYDVFVAESKANRVRVLRSTGGWAATEKTIFTEALDQPYGLAFDGAGHLYVGNTDSVVRFPYKPGDTSTTAQPQTITALTRGGYNQHWTRNLLFADGNKKLYVTVGSTCNVCEETDPARAAISVMNPDGSDRRVFANGMRNPVGMALRPGTDELWTVVNERDRLGDDVPPDYLTNVTAGSFYGWPYAYTTIEGVVTPDPSFGDKSPARVRATVPPAVPVQAHSAALGVAFYSPPGAGGVAFPAEYDGNAFLAFHGSWNRTVKTGYKIVRVNFIKGRPVSVSDFVLGFLRANGTTWGRPVDIAEAPDGSLLFSDDGGGKIWRVAYVGK